jgi:transcriptional regulator with XRE-family HTH domain
MDEETLPQMDHVAKVVAMTFAEKLDQLIRTNRTSQKELAERLGVSPATVSNWVKGVFTPRLAEAAAIAGIFGVSLEFLAFDGVEDPRGPSIPGDGERLVLRTIRALGLDADEAIRRLARPVTDPPAGTPPPLPAPRGPMQVFDAGPKKKPSRRPRRGNADG